MATRRKSPGFNKRTADAIAFHRRLAREANQVLDYGLDELRILVSEALELPCRYCGIPLNASNWGIDHDTPRSRGGSLCLWNVQVICRPCNEAKGALTGEEYASLWAMMVDWPSCARMCVIQRLRSGGRFRR